MRQIAGVARVVGRQRWVRCSIVDEGDAVHAGRRVEAIPRWTVDCTQHHYRALVCNPHKLLSVKNLKMVPGRADLNASALH